MSEVRLGTLAQEYYDVISQLSDFEDEETYPEVGEDTGDDQEDARDDQEDARDDQKDARDDQV